MVTVAPVVDYASSIWKHACGTKGTQYLNKLENMELLQSQGLFGQSQQQYVKQTLVSNPAT